MQRFDLDRSDIDELEANVGPFFGTYTRRPDYDGGVYYDVFEAHERVAAAFQEGSSAEALSEFHADLVEQIRQELPPVSERPSFAFVSSDFWDSGEKFYIWNPTMAGSMTGPLRDIGLGEKDVFAEKYEGSEWGPTAWTADAEALLEADPELIVYKRGFLHLQMDDRDWDLIYSPLRDDPVASEVTAVQEERVYPTHGGPAGPIARPFHTEHFAKVLYPDLFGEHTNANPPYRNITEPLPEEDQLFDRQKHADIINGNL
jgi:iron complex transport system substrate-binding protein